MQKPNRGHHVADRAPDPARVEARRRIVARLNEDDFLQQHLGIAAHTEDVADAVLDVFPVAFWIPGFPDADGPARRYLAVRAEPEGVTG